MLNLSNEQQPGVYRGLAYSNKQPRTKFQKMRFDLKISQERFAQLLSVSTNDIARYERGRLPSLKILLKMIKSAKLNNIDLTLDIFDEEL